MRPPHRLAGMILGLVIGVGSPPSKCVALKRDLIPVAEQVEAAERLAEAALASGDSAQAVDRFCDAWDVGQLGFFDVRFLFEVAIVLRERYEAVFALPGNADAMTSHGWSAGVGSFGCSRAYGGPGGPERFSCMCCPTDVESRCVLRVDELPTRSVRVDLDRDGKAEFVLDSSGARASDAMEMIVDRAPDGRRAQWRLAQRGNDPRNQPSIWAYQDGRWGWIMVDSDGDGRGDCGDEGTR